LTAPGISDAEDFFPSSPSCYKKAADCDGVATPSLSAARCQGHKARASETAMKSPHRRKAPVSRRIAEDVRKKSHHPRQSYPRVRGLGLAWVMKWPSKKMRSISLPSRVAKTSKMPVKGISIRRRVGENTQSAQAESNSLRVAEEVKQRNRLFHCGTVGPPGHRLTMDREPKCPEDGE